MPQATKVQLANQDRVNVYLQKPVRRKLMQALKRRSRIEAVNGRTVATTLSGWLREKAHETIAQFK